MGPINTPARSAIGELASNLADVFGRRCTEVGHVDGSMSPKFSRDVLQMQSPPMEKKLHDAVSHVTATSEDQRNDGPTKPRLTMRISTNATAFASRDKKKSTDNKSKPKKDDKKS